MCQIVEQQPACWFALIFKITWIDAWHAESQYKQNQSNIWNNAENMGAQRQLHIINRVMFTNYITVLGQRVDKNMSKGSWYFAVLQYRNTNRRPNSVIYAGPASWMVNQHWNNINISCLAEWEIEISTCPVNKRRWPMFRLNCVWTTQYSGD